MVAADDRRSPARIVVIDDDAELLELVVGALRSRRYDASGFTSPAEGLALLAGSEVDLLIVDIQMPEFRDTELLQVALDRRPGLVIVLITAFADADLAVRALRAGASDFVTKPFKLDALMLAIERALHERTMRRELARLRSAAGWPPEHQLVARSPAMQRTALLARKASRSSACVLITGESGTGKTVVARWIHQQAHRHAEPFVHVSCELLHASIAETELFGAFEGEGLAAEAAGGTLLLDEVLELPVQVQARVLRYISAAPPPAARVILSTNRLVDPASRERLLQRPNLVAALEALGVLHIPVPPLRDRAEDLPELVGLFLAQAAAAGGRPVQISDAALRWLVQSDWPGNARELTAVIERAVALADRGQLAVDDVVAARARRPDSITALMSVAAERKLSLAEVEIGYIKRVLAHTGNNVTRAAQILGIDRRTLYRKLYESE